MKLQRLADDRIKNGETGFVYPLGDIKALAAAVLKLIELPSIGIQIGAAARAAVAAGPTPLDEAENYVQIFSRLRTIAQNSPGQGGTSRSN